MIRTGKRQWRDAAFAMGAFCAMGASAACAEALRIVAFGTSLTVGQTWPSALGRSLSACLARPVEVDVVAQSGATTRWALANVDRVIALRPDVVLVEFAINDSALQRLMTVSGSRATLETVLARLHAGARGARIIVIRMNPAWGMRGLVRWRRDAFEAAHRAAAETLGAETIDLTPNWRTLSDAQKRVIIPDGLHPDKTTTENIIVKPLATRIAGHACAA